MLERALKNVGVTTSDLVDEYKTIKKKIRNHEVGGNCPAPLLEKVAEEFRRNASFESKTDSFWFTISDISTTIQNDNIDFHASTDRWYDLVITPVDAQIVERMRTHGNMGARD